jgi:hypothetical protein
VSIKKIVQFTAFGVLMWAGFHPLTGEIISLHDQGGGATTETNQLGMFILDEAEWICIPEDITDPMSKFNFVSVRKIFTAADTPKSARMAVTANATAMVFINGRSVGTSKSVWRNGEIDVFDVADYVTAGENVLAVVVIFSVEEGLFAQLAYEKHDGEMIRISTDSSWRYAEGDAYPRTWILPSSQGGSESNHLFRNTVETNRFWRWSVDPGDWWRYYTPSVADIMTYRSYLDVIKPGMARMTGVGHSGMWYTELDSTSSYFGLNESSVKMVGARRAYYMNTGFSGGRVIFLSPHNDILYTGHSLHSYSGENGSLDWLDVRSFLYDHDVFWQGARLPTAKDFGFEPFTHPDGRPVLENELYSVVSAADIGGAIRADTYANESITDGTARATGLDNFVSKLASRNEHTAGKSGWEITRSYPVDRASIQYAQYKARDIEHVVEVYEPDLIHFDHYGMTLINPLQSGFGIWSLQKFGEYMRSHFNQSQLRAIGIEDLSTFDLREYLKSRPWRASMEYQIVSGGKGSGARIASEANGNKFLILAQAEEPSSWAAVIQSVEPLRGRFRISFRIRFEEPAGTVHIQFRDGANKNAVVLRCADTSFFAGGAEIADSIKGGRWYDIGLAIDTDAKSYDVYFDDDMKPVKAGMAFYSPVDEVSLLNYIILESDAGKAVLLDDLSIEVESDNEYDAMLSEDYESFAVGIGPVKRDYWDDERWLSDIVYRCYQLSQIEAGREYYDILYRAVKESSREILGYEIPVTANLIPTFQMAAFLQDALDFPDYEWRMDSGYGFFPTPDGFYPDARLGWSTRLASGYSRTGYSILHAYVDYAHTGEGFEELHKVMHFDALANRAVLSFGYWYLDGYTPGTPESAGFVNTFTEAVSSLVSNRQYIADVGLVASGWSQIAAAPMSGQQKFGDSGSSAGERYLHEFVGWGKYLARSHLQWDVIHEEDITVEELERFQVVILPSILVITDSEAAALEKYVNAGGRLVITGETARYHGPEGYLLPRSSDILASVKERENVRVVTEKPGLAYELDSSSAESSSRLAALVDFENISPSLETDAPVTVGVSLSIDRSVPERLSIDCVNYDLDVEGNIVRPASPFSITLSLPAIKERGVKSIAYTYAGRQNYDVLESLPKDSYELDVPNGTLAIEAPGFTYYQVFFIELEG